MKQVSLNTDELNTPAMRTLCLVYIILSAVYIVENAHPYSSVVKSFGPFVLILLIGIIENKGVKFLPVKPDKRKLTLDERELSARKDVLAVSYSVAGILTCAVVLPLLVFTKPTFTNPFGAIVAYAFLLLTLPVIVSVFRKH